MAATGDPIRGELVPPPKSTRPPLLGSLREWLRIAFVENAALKFVAFVLALTIFILVHSDEDEIYHPWVTVTYTELQDRVLVSKAVDKVQVTVRGSRRRVKRLQKQQLDALHIDLSQLSSGELRLEPDMFRLPDGIELLSITPPSLKLEFDERVEKSVPVVVDFTGVPAKGFKVTNTVVTPTEVTAVGPRRVLDRLNAVSTEEIHLTGRTQSFKGPVQLVTRGFTLEGADSVTVQVSLIDELEARALSARTVVIRPGPGIAIEETKTFVVSPAEVAVTMYGPVRALAAIDEAKVVVVAELAPADLLRREEREVELHVEPALTDIAYKIVPDKVLLRPR